MSQRNRLNALLAMALLAGLAVPEPPPPRRRETEPLDLDPFPRRTSNRPIGNSTDSTIPGVVLVESRPARVSNLPDFYVRGPGWRAAEPPPKTDAEIAAEAKRARKAEKLRAQAARIRGVR